MASVLRENCAPAPPETASAGGWHAELDLEVQWHAGRGSVLTRRRHEGPLRVQKPLYPEGPGQVQMLIVHPPGGVAGGDDLHIKLDLKPDAEALITTPGATKWYKSHGRQASQQIELAVASGALLEWLPQEAIVFDGADIHQRIQVDCASGARACGWDVTVLGRRSADERFTHGRLAQETLITLDGVPCWRERGVLAGGDALLESPIGWNGAHVSGLFWAFGTAWDETLLGACRAVGAGSAHGTLRTGVTVLPQGLMLARIVGDSPERVRSVLTGIWAIVRPALAGRQAVAPRIWAT